MTRRYTRPWSPWYACDDRARRVRLGRDLAHESRWPRPTAASGALPSSRRMLAVLERDGFVRRAADASPRRASELSSTSRSPPAPDETGGRKATTSWALAAPAPRINPKRDTIAPPVAPSAPRPRHIRPANLAARPKETNDSPTGSSSGRRALTRGGSRKALPEFRFVEPGLHFFCARPSGRPLPGPPTTRRRLRHHRDARPPSPPRRGARARCQLVRGNKPSTRGRPGCKASPTASPRTFSRARALRARPNEL